MNVVLFFEGDILGEGLRKLHIKSSGLAPSQKYDFLQIKLL